MIVTLAATIVGAYFGGKARIEDIESDLTEAGGIRIESQSSAGAWLQLPKCSVLELAEPAKKRIWTGCYVKLNGTCLADALIYVENKLITTIELAAPMDDFPSHLIFFEVSQHPTETM